MTDDFGSWVNRCLPNDDVLGLKCLTAKGGGLRGAA
jgi:hypothetical protein